VTTHTPNLPRLFLRWTLLLGALFALGPIAGHLVNTLHAADGGADATPLVSTSPVRGVFIAAVVMLLALAVGVTGGRIFGPRLGLRTAGFVLAWAAWLTGTVDAILRQSQSRAPMWTLALEGLIVGVMALVVFVLVVALARPHNEHEQAEFAMTGKDPLTTVTRDLRKLASTGALVGLVGAIIAGGIVAWIIAFEPLKGQTVMAAFFGGIAAAAVGRLAASMVGQDAPVMVYFIAIVVLAIASPASAALVHSSGDQLLDASYAGTMFALGHILPLDWLAGGMLGVPIGLAWVGSMIERHEA